MTTVNGIMAVAAIVLAPPPMRRVSRVEGVLVVSLDFIQCMLEK